MTMGPSSDESALSREARADRDARLTWTIGGAALLGSVLIPVITPPGTLVGVAYVGTVLHAGAILLFALGIRGHGSVTARRPLGTASLVILAVVTLVWSVVAAPIVSALVADSESGSWRMPEWWSTLVTLEQYVVLALAITAVVQIARRGAVPRPWNLAPLWALGAMVVSMAALQIAGTAGADQRALVALNGVVGLVHVVAYVTLGILAIVLAARQRPDTVAVYRGSSGAAD